MDFLCCRFMNTSCNKQPCLCHKRTRLFEQLMVIYLLWCIIGDENIHIIVNWITVWPDKRIILVCDNKPTLFKVSTWFDDWRKCDVERWQLDGGVEVSLEKWSEVGTFRFCIRPSIGPCIHILYIGPYPYPYPYPYPWEWEWEWEWEWGPETPPFSFIISGNVSE